MKQQRWIVGAVLLICLLTGCDGSSSPYFSSDESGITTHFQQNDEIRIGMALQDLENDYMVRLAQEAQTYAKDQGIDLKVYDGGGSTQKQIWQVEQMISAQVDGILLSAVTESDGLICVEKAKKAGIPVIALHTRLDRDKIASFVGCDDTKAGKLLMAEMAQALGGQGRIAILQGSSEQSVTAQRLEGMREELQNYDGIQVISCKTANWSQLEAEVVVQKWLSVFEQLDGVIAENDMMAIGAVKAAKNAGVSLRIVGMDGSQEAQRAVEQGSMQATIYQDAQAQSRTALDVMLETLDGKKVEQEYKIPLQIIAKQPQQVVSKSE